MDLSTMHDADLDLDNPVHAAEETRRARAADAIRTIVSRAYARGDMMTARQWHVLPYLTTDGTLGLVDIAQGTAWDTDRPLVVEDVAALGFLGSGATYAAAAMAEGARGDVRIDGELVQRYGATPGASVTAPYGWRQILLPTWRGHGGTSPYQPVPASVYGHGWVRPRLVAWGLTTCYGQPGVEPERTPDGRGYVLAYTQGWETDRRRACECAYPCIDDARYERRHVTRSPWQRGLPAWIRSGEARR